MDRGNGSSLGDEAKPGYAPLKVFVPVELKYLIGTFKVQKRYPSFTYAVRVLLETHPELAKLAAQLYTESQREPGRASESEIPP